MNLSVIILGAGGHAKVVIEALLNSAVVIVGIADPASALIGTTILGVPVLGGDHIVEDFSPSEIMLVNGLGSIGLPIKRQHLFERFEKSGYGFATVVHPSAVIASDVQIGVGAQIMAGVVIQPGSRIGRNVIVNTRTSLDHDCTISDHVHIAPGVTFSGDVAVGETSHIGTGATVIQGVSIGAQSVVGAGSLVLRNVPSNCTVLGVPAKRVAL